MESTESAVKMHTRGVRYSIRAFDLRLVGIAGLIVLVIYTLFCGQYLIAIGIVAVGVVFFVSVALELQGDKTLQRAGQLSAVRNPAEPIKGVRE